MAMTGKNTSEHNWVEGKSNEDYRALFEAAADGMFLTHERAGFADVNQAACTSLGYSKQELLRLTIKQIDDDNTGYQAFEKIRNDRVREIVFRVNQRKKNGELLPVEITAAPFSGLGRKRFIAIARSLESRGTMEEGLADSDRVLKQYGKLLHERMTTGRLPGDEILEYLLAFGNHGRNARETVGRLLKRFGNLNGVISADIGELKAVAGLNPASIVLFRLVKEACIAVLREKTTHRDLLESPESAVDFARATLSHSDTEVSMVIYLNAGNEMIDYEVMKEGTASTPLVYPRRVIEGALAHHAAGLILIHIHPGPSSIPSAYDKQLTRTLIDATMSIDIRVLDHIIISGSGHFSFLQNGLLR